MKESEFGTISGITGFFGNLGGVVAQTPLAILTAAISRILRRGYTASNSRLCNR